MTTDDVYSVMKLYKHSLNIIVLNNVKLYGVRDYYRYRGVLYLFTEEGTMADIIIDMEHIESLEVVSR